LVGGGVWVYSKVIAPIEKEKSVARKRRESIEKNIIRKRLMKERSRELEGLSADEREHLLKMWTEERHRKKIFGFKGKKKRPRQPIPPKLRRVILRAYNAHCAMCDRLESVEIHHIDGNRSNSSPKNLIPLCRVCHRRNYTLDQLKAQWKPPKYRH
jgi:5-methylcytosine-specific restriction endonuclease McrA